MLKHKSPIWNGVFRDAGWEGDTSNTKLAATMTMLLKTESAGRTIKAVSYGDDDNLYFQYFDFEARRCRFLNPEPESGMF